MSSTWSKLWLITLALLSVAASRHFAGVVGGIFLEGWYAISSILCMLGAFGYLICAATLTDK